MNSSMGQIFSQPLSLLSIPLQNADCRGRRAARQSINAVLSWRGLSHTPLLRSGKGSARVNLGYARRAAALAGRDRFTWQRNTHTQQHTLLSPMPRGAGPAPQPFPSRRSRCSFKSCRPPLRAPLPAALIGRPGRRSPPVPVSATLPC